MKDELKKSIDQAAAEVRSAIASAKQAEENIKANETKIDSLQEQIRFAVIQRGSLQIALCEKNEATAKASQRYNFFINEAVYHPY